MAAWYPWVAVLRLSCAIVFVGSVTDVLSVGGQSGRRPLPFPRAPRVKREELEIDTHQGRDGGLQWSIERCGVPAHA